MQIYLSHERETKLRNFASTSKQTIASIIGELVDSLGEDIPKSFTSELPDKEFSELMPMCGKNFCKSRSIGKYKIITNDGENEIELDLCTFHWNQARKEGEVRNV